ncbi:hypothetical protein EVAR_45890_1 [Eumeta japonica]|uniref:Uncharacterized protein n=1 Tax=Eumeta variegata TaxID=151549 RepID=A0A4C1XUT7_EUMVA|nr:hypothetical protein EVAR_45890_1 [Eumeta japonica]
MILKRGHGEHCSSSASRVEILIIFGSTGGPFERGVYAARGPAAGSALLSRLFHEILITVQREDEVESHCGAGERSLLNPHKGGRYATSGAVYYELGSGWGEEEGTERAIIHISDTTIRGELDVGAGAGARGAPHDTMQGPLVAGRERAVTSDDIFTR